VWTQRKARTYSHNRRLPSRVSTNRGNNKDSCHRNNYSYIPKPFQNVRKCYLGKMVAWASLLLDRQQFWVSGPGESLFPASNIFFVYELINHSPRMQRCNNQQLSFLTAIPRDEASTSEPHQLHVCIFINRQRVCFVNQFLESNQLPTYLQHRTSGTYTVKLALHAGMTLRIY